MILEASIVILGFLVLFFAGYFLTRRTLTALAESRAKATTASNSLVSTQNSRPCPGNIKLAAQVGGGASIALAIALMAIIPQRGLLIWLVCIALGYGISFLRFPR